MLLGAVAAGLAVRMALQVEGAFQRDADIVRLRHLEHYTMLLEEYRAKTGKSPLQGRADVPIYVFVAHGDQLQSPPPGPPYAHDVIPLSEFLTELEAGLGRRVRELYDPQLRSTGRPNYYLYMTTQDAYFFAVHLHGERTFANEVARDYWKIEVSNRANPQNGALDAAELATSGEFAAAVRESLRKPGFFDQRERKYEDWVRSATVRAEP